MDSKIVDLTYKLLVGIAKSGDLINYGELYSQIDVDPRDPRQRHYASEILESVNNISMKEHSVMITAVAIDKEKNISGGGFFTLAIEFDKLSSDSDELERLSFWSNEVKKVHELYKENDEV